MQPGNLLPKKGCVIPHSANGYLPVFIARVQERLAIKKQRCRCVRMTGIPISAVAAAAPSTRLKVYTVSEMTEAELVASTARPRIDFNDILGTVIFVHISMHVSKGS